MFGISGQEECVSNLGFHFEVCHARQVWKSFGGGKAFSRQKNAQNDLFTRVFRQCQWFKGEQSTLNSPTLLSDF